MIICLLLHYSYPLFACSLYVLENSCDRQSGYHEIYIEETHKERTAFTAGHLGFYEYQRMPYGLANSPATYQRWMQQYLGDLHLKNCVIFRWPYYISNFYEEHLDKLELVMDRLREYGLKLISKKCAFFQRRMDLKHIQDIYSILLMSKMQLGYKSYEGYLCFG